MQVSELHKHDQFGRVERVTIDGADCTRRVASGSRLPFSGWIARRLLARERRALRALAGLAGIPRERDGGTAKVLVREWVAGVPLSRAGSLPVDFFENLDALVAAIHARGVCHNDLHKEANVLLGDDGFPWLIDFQLASVHARGGRSFETRRREDLRHVEKHRRRYTRHGRGPNGVESSGAGAGIPRSGLARAWRRLGKPLYTAITRGVLGTRDGGDAQRPPHGPWPTWTVASGSRASPRSHGSDVDAVHRMSSR